MDKDTLALLVFLLTMIFGLASWIFQFRVSRKLTKTGQDPGVPIGKNSWITPLVLGWKYAEALGMQTLMSIWSIFLALTVLGVFFTVYLFVSLYGVS